MGCRGRLWWVHSTYLNKKRDYIKREEREKVEKLWKRRRSKRN